MKKRSRKPQKKTTAVVIRKTPQAFESAFIARIGQTPEQFITSKLKAGSTVNDTRYLYVITADAIAKQNNCLAFPFEQYYVPLEVNAKMSKTTVYNKLVRDRIPELVRESGRECTIEVVDEEAYLLLLEKKLQEELSSYQQKKSLEELADLLEVLGAVVRARGSSWEELTAIRKRRKEQYGGYDKKYLLKEITSSR